MATETNQPALTDEEINALRSARRAKAKKYLRKFWIGGMAGAFFAGIAHSIPVDYKTLTFTNYIWKDTFDAVLRYGYMSWLMVYFFITTFDTDEDEGGRGREPHKGKEIFYDITQSIAATFAVFTLGPPAVATAHHGTGDFVVANIVILVISLSAFVLFRDDPTKYIQMLRISVTIFAVIGLGLLWKLSASAALSGLLLLLLVGLCAALWLYGYRRINEPSGGFLKGKSPSVEPACAKPVEQALVVESATAAAPSAPPNAPPVASPETAQKDSGKVAATEAPKTPQP